jgi:hypothetical protein
VSSAGSLFAAFFPPFEAFFFEAAAFRFFSASAASISRGLPTSSMIAI